MDEEVRVFEKWIEGMPGGLERIRERVGLVGLGVKRELGNLDEKRGQVDGEIEKVKKKIRALEVKVGFLRKVLEDEGEEIEIGNKEGWENEEKSGEVKREGRSERVKRDLLWGEESMKMLKEMERI